MNNLFRRTKYLYYLAAEHGRKEEAAVLERLLEDLHNINTKSTAPEVASLTPKKAQA